MRTFLGCSPVYSEPCLGFTGDCGDLQDQFKDVPDSGIPDDWECTEFPARAQRRSAPLHHDCMRARV